MTAWRVVALAAALAGACGHGRSSPVATRGSSSPAGVPPSDATTSIAGLWGQELEQPASGSGSLVLVRDGERWRAELAGESVELARDHDEWRGELASGELRVRVARGEPRARWRQRGGELLGPYATMIVLAPAGAARWTGTVAPLPARLRLYLHVAADGAAFVRETEVNLGRRLGMLRLETSAGGRELVFRDAKGDAAIRATLAGDHLHARVAGVDVAFDLTRRDRDHAPGFYPRPAGDGGTLQPVRDLGDGWPVATPEQVGLDPAALQAIVRDLVAAVPTSPASPAIHALAIARHGKLVVDEYFAGDGPDELHDLRSAGKTLSTTLVGIAIDHHELATTERL
ncbi:MAG: hypothetical protein ACM31C_07230, partial [Acidobacteriota bacterium]